MNFRKIALLAVAALLVFSLAACGSSEENTASPFQNMEAADLDGNTVTSSVFESNKLTLVNVWNIGCTPCVMEMPVLDQVNKDYAEQGVAVLGLYYNFGSEISEEDRATIDGILEGLELTQIIPSEDMMATKELKRMDMFPTTFVVDSEGKIVDSLVGSRDYEGWAEAIDQQLQKLDG